MSQFWIGYACGLVTPFILLALILLAILLLPRSLFYRYTSWECAYCNRMLLPERQGRTYSGLTVLLRWWPHELSPAHRRNRKKMKPIGGDVG